MKNGIIAINKPEGISSARVVSRVKKALGVKKAGHTGTLDPFATGLILCSVNKATRISQFFLNGHKRYLARISLGRETDTYDLTGKTTFEAPREFINTLKKENIEQVLNSFKGLQDQVPPSFSALKHKGQPLYKLARQGKMVLKPPRKIEIFELKTENINLPYIDIEVFCSSGTYIRSLAFDIGRKLKCGAHLATLCRTASSAFKLEDAIDLSELESLDKKTAMQKIIPMSDCLQFMPKIIADDFVIQKIKFGQNLSIQELKPPITEASKPIRVVDATSNLLAIIQLNENMLEYNYSCVFIT